MTRRARLLRAGLCATALALVALSRAAHAQDIPESTCETDDDCEPGDECKTTMEWFENRCEETECTDAGVCEDPVCSEDQGEVRECVVRGRCPIPDPCPALWSCATFGEVCGDTSPPSCQDNAFHSCRAGGLHRVCNSSADCADGFECRSEYFEGCSGSSCPPLPPESTQCMAVDACDSDADCDSGFECQLNPFWQGCSEPADAGSGDGPAAPVCSPSSAPEMVCAPPGFDAIPEGPAPLPSREQSQSAEDASADASNDACNATSRGRSPWSTIVLLVLTMLGLARRRRGPARYKPGVEVSMASSAGSGRSKRAIPKVFHR